MVSSGPLTEGGQAAYRNHEGSGGGGQWIGANRDGSTQYSTREEGREGLPSWPSGGGGWGVGVKQTQKRELLRFKNGKKKGREGTGAVLGDPPGESQLAEELRKKQLGMASAVLPCGGASSGLGPPLASWYHRKRWQPPGLGCPPLRPPLATAGGCTWLLWLLAHPAIRAFSCFQYPCLVVLWYSKQSHYPLFRILLFPL